MGRVLMEEKMHWILESLTKDENGNIIYDGWRIKKDYQIFKETLH